GVDQSDDWARVLTDGFERQVFDVVSGADANGRHRYDAVHGVRILFDVREVGRHVIAVDQAQREGLANALGSPGLQVESERIPDRQQQPALLVAQQRAIVRIGFRERQDVECRRQCMQTPVGERGQLQRLREYRGEFRRRQFQLFVQKLDDAALGRLRQFAGFFDLLYGHARALRYRPFDARVH